MSRPAVRPIPLRLPLLALVVLLPLFPPETRGSAMAGCALLIGVACWLPGNDWPRGRSATALCVAALLVWLSTFANPMPGSVVEPWITFSLAGAIGLAAANGRLGERDVKPVLGGLVLAASVSSVHALVQRFGGLRSLAEQLAPAADSVEQRAIVARLAEGRAFAAFATPAALGAFLVLALPVTVALALAARGRWRVVLVLAAALQVGALAATMSVTAMVALAAVLPTLLLHGRRAGRAILLGAGVLAIAVTAVVAVRGIDLGGENSPVRLRAGNFRIAAEMAADHPWVGVGAGNFGEAYPAYRTARDNETQHAHNLPLEAVAETGVVPGLLLTALFFAAFAWPAVRSGERPAWHRGAALGAAAVAVQNLADFTAFFPSVLWPAAIIAGLLRAKTTRPSGTRPGSAAAGWLPRVVVAGTVLLAVGQGVAEFHLMAARKEILAERFDDAARSARRAAAAAPWAADPALLRARLALEHSAQEGAAATVLTERAVRLAPLRPSAYALRARARLDGDDLPGAWADMARAAEMYPLSSEYRAQRDRLAAAVVASIPPEVLAR